MSETQEADKGMRVMAVVGGFVAIIEAVMQFMDAGIMPYGFGIIGAVFSLIFAIVAIALGIKPLNYTPFILALVGILLIVFASLIGGVFILLATFIGFLS
ncbi:MAG: hypothetical protein KGD73_04510 [Candidatus Lokiarchaeota archaeon]|nr:hypothetical protein [Candidatus Lokiarchaeota archaeon]